MTVKAVVDEEVMVRRRRERVASPWESVFGELFKFYVPNSANRNASKRLVFLVAPQRVLDLLFASFEIEICYPDLDF